MPANSDRLFEILDQVAVMDLQEAVNKIVTVLRGNIQFLNLKAQLIKLDQDRNGDIISLNDYNIGLNNKRNSLIFFLKQLKPAELEKVYEVLLLGTVPSTSGKNKIFISYRKEDSSGYALALYNELCKWYNKDMIFKDFNSIIPGKNFEEAIDEALNNCSVLLVVINDKWTEILKQRLSNLQQKDFVKIEVSTALSKGIQTIPVIINKTAMPVENELPDELKALSKMQYLNMDQTRFEYDTSQLVKIIDEKLNIKRDNN
jgi:hypothetical protein